MDFVIRSTFLNTNLGDLFIFNYFFYLNYFYSTLLYPNFTRQRVCNVDSIIIRNLLNRHFLSQVDLQLSDKRV